MGEKYKLYFKVSDEDDGVEIKEFRRSSANYPLYDHIPYDLSAILRSFPRPMQILATAIMSVCETDSPDLWEGDNQLYEAAARCIQFWEKHDDEMDQATGATT